ncbi:uncharacterized protein LOC126549931 [Aphis gossypii]|uniref:uncharacterized protein LOC126549931 n=1 Tax=Aphis gossypii TaxID=80765 RepID=UPI00215979F2|nr:uncharacterized protein LOC126549931 [Aphis gossypii]
MAHCSTLIVIIASSLCVHTILAYPTSIERVSGDNNYQPLRNSASIDRFIETFCDDDNECKIPSDVIDAALGVTLDRMNGGHVMAAKRDSLDRLNGGHTMAAKRDSLDRLNGGHTMAAKRDSLDRLGVGHLMTAKRSSLDRLNGGHTMAAKRDSLDRLNGGHVMAAKRDSLDRLNGGHVMAAKRDSLDRLNGGHVMAAKRDSLDRLNGGHVMAAKRSDRLSGGGLAVVAGGPLSVRGQMRSARQQKQQQTLKYPLTLARWSEIDSDDDRDAYYSNVGDEYYLNDDCLSCGLSAEASAF